MVIWYHGSMQVLVELANGSTITRNRELARVFSHRPTIVSWEDDGRLRHNGAAPGYLYAIAEPLSAADIYPHPRSSMPAGSEWLTRRPLRLALIEPTTLRPAELLSDQDLRALRG